MVKGRRLDHKLLHPIETNIVYFELPEGQEPAEMEKRWQAQGLLIGHVYGRSFRAVTHYGIETKDIEQTLVIMGQG